MKIVSDSKLTKKTTEAYSSFMKTLVKTADDNEIKKKRKKLESLYKELYSKESSGIDKFIKELMSRVQTMMKSMVKINLSDAKIYSVDTDQGDFLLLASDKNPLLPPSSTNDNTLAGIAAMAIFTFKGEPLTVTALDKTYKIILIRNKTISEAKGKPILDQLIKHEAQHYVDGLIKPDVLKFKSIKDFGTAYVDEEQRINFKVAPKLHKTYDKLLRNMTPDVEISFIQAGLLSTMSTLNDTSFNHVLKLIKQEKDKSLQRKILTGLLST